MKKNEKTKKKKGKKEEENKVNSFFLFEKLENKIN